MQRLILFFVILISSVRLNAQEKSILFLHGYLHPGNGESLVSAAIGVKNGKISVIKNSLAYTYSASDWDTIIDLNGKHVYPGFIATNTTLGITEIDAIRATRDFDEVGELNPHIRSQIAYNVESDVIKTVRANGILLCQTTPRGGRISGTSSIMAMDGWNWEDATIHSDDGIHINWPSSIQRNKDDHQIQEKSKDYVERKAAIYSFFKAAQAYSLDKNPEFKDLRFEAIKECFKGNKRVYIHANELQQLNDLIDFAQEFQLSFPVIVGGYDTYLITRKLKDAKIPVMICRPHSLPNREDDPTDLPYQLAFKLQSDGLLFCIQNEGDMEAMNGRNLPFLAGTARAYGLTDDQAVAAISYNACKIVGIDKNFGSIEIGKSATLFVSEGNALDMRTNDVSIALINGAFVDLNTKQKELYLKYKSKYQNQ